jgi:Ca2+-binding RTX toxin-like protein
MPVASLTAEEAGAWIARSGEKWESNTLNYSFLTSFPAGFDGAQGFQAFDAEAQAVTRLALDLWSDVTGITFNEVPADQAADLRFFAHDMRVPDQAVGDEPLTDPDDSQSDIDPGAAYGQMPNAAGGSIVQVNTNWNGWATMGEGVAGLNGLNLLVHEIGHTLGLLHPGDYDVSWIDTDPDGDGDSDLDDDALNYDIYAEYIEDSSQYSLMSYWTEYNTGADFNFNAPMTPMLHDIAAVQLPEMYGAPLFTRFGDTTYGFNSNADRIVYRFDELTDGNGTRLPVFSIYDTGGNDTLDVSGYTVDQLIDLHSGAFSDIGGLVKNISISVTTNIENAVGGSGDDDITGNDLANLLEGGDGDDTIDGEGGNDTIYGDAGEDWLYGDLGNDTVNGGANSDNVYGNEGNDVLSGGQGVDWLFGGEGTDNISGDDDGDYIWGDDQVQLYNVDAAGEMDPGLGFGDSIFGGNGNDVIYGGYGGDLIEGGEGDDYIEGGPGQDFIIGGGGIDTLGYSYTDFDWTIRLDLGQARIGGLVFETFYLMENADMGSGNDTVIGSDGANEVWGFLGDDTINGNGGEDILHGSFGRDTLNGGDGNDTLNGGTDDDIMSGCNDWDIMDGGDGADTMMGDGGSDLMYGGNGKDVMSGGNDSDGMLGDDGNDVLAGDNGDDQLVGGRGDDIVNGGANNDRIIWGPGSVDGPWPHAQIHGEPDDKSDPFDGNDDYDGGAGIDVVDYDGTFMGVNVDLSRNVDHGFGAEIGVDQIANVENLIGGNGNDVLRGDGNNNHFWVRYGNDTMSDGLGNDILEGERGDDTFEAYAGNNFGPVNDDDIFDGGLGIDTVSYASATKGVSIYLNSANSFGKPTAAGVQIGVDSLIGIENATGGSGNDTIVGHSFANVLNGGGGKDTIRSGAGDDEVNAGDGNDRVFLDLGNDLLNGGAGIDILDASETLGGAIVNFATGHASGAQIGSDTISGFETFNGSASADIVTGSNNSENLYGNLGEDLIVAGGGNDLVTGGFDADTLYGGAGDDVINGDHGDDYLNGGLGADDLDGGDGSDWVSYSASASGVTLDLRNAIGTGSGGEAEGDTLVNIEKINGSAHADTVYGNAIEETIYGNGGSDNLYGYVGEDGLFGGDGDDYLQGGEGADYLDGGAGSDWAAYSLSAGFVSVDLQAGAGIAGTALGDILVNIEKLYGSDFGDGLRGDANANVLYGRGGNGILDGRGGNDYLAGGSGINTMTGGTGDDTFRFDAADFANGIQSTITDFHETVGMDFDALLLQGAAGDYALADQGGDLLVTHIASGGTILVQNFSVAQMADQASFF